MLCNMIKKNFNYSRNFGTYVWFCLVKMDIKLIDYQLSIFGVERIFVLMLNIIGTPLRKVMMICNNLHAIMLFWVQWTLTTLKYFYRGKKSLYLYSVKNFFPYLMCDIINLLMQTQHPHCVYRITRPNKQTPFMESNKFSYQG